MCITNKNYIPNEAATEFELRNLNHTTKREVEMGRKRGGRRGRGSVVWTSDRGPVVASTDEQYEGLASSTVRRFISQLSMNGFSDSQVERIGIALFKYIASFEDVTFATFVEHLPNQLEFVFGVQQYLTMATKDEQETAICVLEKLVDMVVRIASMDFSRMLETKKDTIRSVDVRLGDTFRDMVKSSRLRMEAASNKGV